MAQGIVFVCNHCRHSIEAWDEGNPYYFGAEGQKRYAFHPDPERDLCIGIDSPHLCLGCGEEFDVDSRGPITQCPRCSSPEITDLAGLPGKRCPFCKEGTFGVDPTVYMIS